MDVNPAYGDFASNSVKTDEDTGLDKALDTHQVNKNWWY